MALPKSKISRTRGRKRRTHYKMKKINLVPCKNCSTPKLPHRVCPNCGFYNGRKVELKVEKESKKSGSKKE